MCSGLRALSVGRTLCGEPARPFVGGRPRRLPLPALRFGFASRSSWTCRFSGLARRDRTRPPRPGVCFVLTDPSYYLEFKLASVSPIFHPTLQHGPIRLHFTQGPIRLPCFLFPSSRLAACWPRNALVGSRRRPPIAPTAVGGRAPRTFTQPSSSSLAARYCRTGLPPRTPAPADHDAAPHDR